MTSSRTVRLARRPVGVPVADDFSITTDEVPETPFGQAFRVREVLPFDERKLKTALRERGIGTLEIKKRGVDVDPAAFRAKLGLKGAEAATLVLTRTGGRRVAILADRVDG